MGYLEGTGKALHTINNYRFDLASFREFLERRGCRDLHELAARDLVAFHDCLKARGLKTNTRRRQLLTAHRFLRYLSRRKKIGPEIDRKMPAPQKIERIPFTVSSGDLIAAIRDLETSTEFDRRSRALLWVLAETGCRVSEAATLRFRQIGYREQGGASIDFEGKFERWVPISRELLAALESLRRSESGDASGLEDSPVFRGFNKSAARTTPISSRGIELVVKAYAPRLGHPALTPRTFRHSAVLGWYAARVAREEILRRLGLRTPYAFRVYEPLLKSSFEATST